MKIALTEKQQNFFDAFQSLKYRYLLFGGGFAGGKSWILSLIIIGLCIQFPHSRYAIFRKNLTVLRRTTLVTFRKVLSVLKYHPMWNANTMTYTFSNGSQVLFLEADITKDPDCLKLKGLELTTAAIDEADEVAKDIVHVLMGRIGRWNQWTGFDIPACLLMTCNPNQGWLREMFYDPWRAKTLAAPYFFEQALAKDNSFLSAAYLQSLEELPPAEYERYVLGNWDFSDDPNQLIPYQLLKENFLDSDVVDIDIQATQYLGVDVAREGNDRTVYTFFQDHMLYKQLVRVKQDLMTTANEVALMMEELGIGYQRVGVDVIGMGGGVVDPLYAKGLKVYDFNSSSAPPEEGSHLQFKNLRAYAYWTFRKDLEDHKIKVVHLPELFKELTSVRYFVKDKVLSIENKQEMKKRLGHSPDLADSAIIASFMRHQKNTPLQLQKQTETREDRPILADIRTMSF